MSKYRVKFSCFPKTSPPPAFAAQVVAAFDVHYDAIATEKLPKGLTSDAVLAELHKDLKNLGFTLESGKASANLIDRPVFFGENGEPEVASRPFPKTTRTRLRWRERCSDTLEFGCPSG